MIGNPPYQEETSSDVEIKRGQQKTVKNVFHTFQMAADRYTKESAVLIYPGGRWIHQSGKGVKDFGKEQINSPHLSKLYFYPNVNELFGNVGIADGISIVSKKYSKTSGGFVYHYCVEGDESVIDMANPGDELMPLNPADMLIVRNIGRFIVDHDLLPLSESWVIRNSRLFRIESNFVELNPDKVVPYSGQQFDQTSTIKLLTNDKAGKAGRAKWFLTSRDTIQVNQHLVDEWQVVVSSANAGGQKRDNQIQIIDNHSAFGRSRLALKSFKTENEAENFLKYANSSIIRFAFLMTGEDLSSLAKKVPDIIDYTDGSRLINFSNDIDEQLCELIGLTNEQMTYICQRVKERR